MGAEMSTLRPCKRFPPVRSVSTSSLRRLEAGLKAQLKAELKAELKAQAEPPGQRRGLIIKIISNFPTLFLEIKGNYYIVDPTFKAQPGTELFENFISCLIQIGTLPSEASEHPTMAINESERNEQFSHGPSLRKLLARELQQYGIDYDGLISARPAPGFPVAAPGDNALKIYIHSAFNQLSQSRRCHIHQPQTLARRLASLEREREFQMPTPPGTPSPKKGRPGLPRGSFQTSNASQKLRALLSGPSQTSGSMQGLDGASSINEYSCTPSKFLIFNADGVVVFTFEEKAPDDQINTWECLNWKEFTEEERDRALRLYLSTCIECWRTKHFNSVIDDAKALSFKSLDEALEHDKSIMDNLYILIADLSPAAREEQDRIFNWYTKIWEELEAKDDHELLTIYAAVEDEFRLSQDFRRILASKARMLKDINVLRQLSVEDVVFLLFMIKIRRIRAMDMGKALAKKKMAEEALAKKTKAKDKTKVKKKKKTKDREKNAREKADWAYSKSVDEFIATELKPTTESETIRLKRDFEIVVMLLEGEHEIVATWVIATDVIIADLLYKVYQHVKADLQSNIDESYPGLQKEGSAVDPNDDEEPEASEVQYPQGKNSQAEDWNVDPDFDKGHTGPEAQKPQVEGWNMDPNVAEEFERILFQPFYNTHEYILGLVKKTDMAE